MQCLILAGGKGTRLGALGASRPKHLVEVAGTPFADLQLAWLAQGGVTSVVYCIGHLGDAIRDHVGDGARFGVRSTYVDEGADLQGTAGAIRMAVDAGEVGERCFVLYGDSYLRLDLADLWATSTGNDAAVTMAVYRNEGAHDTSNVIVDGDRVALYDKHASDDVRSRMQYIDYGISVLVRDEVAPRLPAGAGDLADVVHELSVAGRVAAYEVADRFYEVGTPAGIAALESHLAAPTDPTPTGDPRPAPLSAVDAEKESTT